jgi:hypothetical protein
MRSDGARDSGNASCAACDEGILVFELPNHHVQLSDADMISLIAGVRS